MALFDTTEEVIVYFLSFALGVVIGFRWGVYATLDPRKERPNG